MAEGTPAPSGHWMPLIHDSGYSTTTPSPSSIPSLSPELRIAAGASPRKRSCISSTPAIQFACPLTKRISLRKSLLSLSDLEDSVFEPAGDGIHEEDFQDAFEEMEVEDVDHQEVVQEKTNKEIKNFVFEDFGRVPCSRPVPNRRSYVGREKMDFLALMGELNDYSPVLSKIFGYLPVEDLLNVSLVCKRWWRICKADRNVQTRMTKYLEKINKNKENMGADQPKKSKSATSDLTAYTPRRHFFEIQNISRENNTRPVSTRSPPVSPSKFRFHQFFKVAQKISDGSTLAPCPRCSLPSLIDSKKNVGQCTCEGCRYIFCSLCRCESHETQPCRASMLAPRSRNRLGSIGSKASKRNLRRLC